VAVQVPEFQTRHELRPGAECQRGDHPQAERSIRYLRTRLRAARIRRGWDSVAETRLDRALEVRRGTQ
jgi:hypothetical protein